MEDNLHEWDLPAMKRETLRVDRARKHKMVTAKLRKDAPEIGATAELDATMTIVVAKFFSIFNDWRWYLIELDAETGEAFGLVDGFEAELGGFNVYEMGSHTKMQGRLPVVERDLGFTPLTLADLYVWTRTSVGISGRISPRTMAM